MNGKNTSAGNDNSNNYCLNVKECDCQTLRKALRKNFAYEALFTGEINRSRLTNLMSALNITRLPTVAMLAQADRDENNKTIFMDDHEKLFTAMTDVFRENLREFGLEKSDENNIFVVPGDSGIVALLPIDILSGQEPSIELSKTFAGLLKKHLAAKLPFTVTIAIGGGYADFTYIRQSYKEAATALQYKFYQGNSLIIHYNDFICYPEVSQQFFIENESKLLEAIRKGDWQQMAGLVHSLLDKVQKEQLVSPEVLKVRILEMLTGISRTSMELGVDVNLLLDIKVRTGREIETITSLAQLKKWLGEIIREFCFHLQDVQKDAITKAVFKTKQYIDENYFKNITLEELARIVYVSPFYLSRSFAELTGTSFTEYLKSVRIRKAQNLLSVTRYSINKIASSVGYNDPNYFSRVFKAFTGKSPQQYRKGNQSKKN